MEFPRNISRPTATQALFNTYALVKIYNVGLFFRSNFLGVRIDGTTDRYQRSPLAFLLSGKVDGQDWALPLGIREPGNHQAKTQVPVLLELLEEINWIGQRCFPESRPVRPYHLLFLGVDTTSSNTGDNGVRGNLEREREKAWEEDQNEGLCPPLVLVGCEDHLINLTSEDVERFFVKEQSHLTINNKHRVTDWVQFIFQKLSRAPVRLPFKAFLQE